MVASVYIKVKLHNSTFDVQFLILPFPECLQIFIFYPLTPKGPSSFLAAVAPFCLLWRLTNHSDKSTFLTLFWMARMAPMAQVTRLITDQWSYLLEVEGSYWPEFETIISDPLTVKLRFTSRKTGRTLTKVGCFGHTNTAAQNASARQNIASGGEKEEDDNEVWVARRSVKEKSQRFSKTFKSFCSGHTVWERLKLQSRQIIQTQHKVFDKRCCETILNVWRTSSLLWSLPLENLTTHFWLFQIRQ